MKRSLLTLITLTFAIVAFGQQNIPVRNEASACRLKFEPQQDGTPYSNPLMVTHVLPPKHVDGGLRTLNEVKFSSSHNGFGLIVSESQCLTANTDLKLINFTQRAPESIVQANGGATNATGIITNSFSTDNGATWDTNNVVMSLQGSDNHCRYPSGGIYNPAGNTDPLQAYAVVGGPATNDDAANGWVKYYYGSMRLDETNNDQQFYNNQNGNTFQEMSRLSFTTCGDKAFVLGSNYDYNTSQVVVGYQGGVINRGVFNGTSNNFDWTQINVHVPLAYDQTGAQQFANLGNLAFNDDGSVGYFVIIGVDSLNPIGYFPIVFKSLDFGQTWSQQSFYDFRDIPTWNNFLIPTIDGGEAKPFFSSTDGFDAVVDHNGNLHLIGSIYSAYADGADSLGFIYTTRAQLFDVFQSGDVWEATYIDSIAASNGTSLVWTSVTGPVGVDARVQAATSPDRTKIFVIWADTDPTLSDLNDYPDIMGMGIDVDNTANNTAVINFTGGTEFTFLNSWHYVSDRAFDDGGGMFSVPVTISLSNDQQNTLDNQMDHYYVSDVTFPFVTGVPSVSNAAFTVDQNYPNPFSDQTKIKVTLDKALTVNLKITNILGQEVGNKDFSFSAGDHFMSMSKGDLGSGVYNFTVTADGKQVSKTMIIQ